MRNRFDEQLFELNREIIEMGAMCEEAIASAVKALSAGEVALAEKVRTNSGAIDQMERDIEGRCMKLLLHQQPVARDPRQISAALKMITGYLIFISSSFPCLTDTVAVLPGSTSLLIPY